LAPVFSDIAFGYQGWRDQDQQVMTRHGDSKMSVFATVRDRDGARYDLGKDPAERNNLFGEPTREQRAQKLLEKISAS
jgi:hypothetical protein